MARVRIRFAKLGKIRWTSHRDTARMWERAFRRVELPLVYTEGFSPRPKVSFGLALPTGHESRAEYLDVEVAATPAGARITDDLDALLGLLSVALPEGVSATAAAVIPPGTPSLQETVTSCTWRWTAVAADGSAVDEAGLAGRAAQLMAAPSVTVTRRRKGAEVTDDIRGAVLALRVIGPSEPPIVGGVVLEAELACQPRSLRPSELLAGLGAELVERDTRRLHQWISRDGARREPLAGPAVATDAPHALERAS
jgi:radical SAM-linked protein